MLSYSRPARAATGIPKKGAQWASLTATNNTGKPLPKRGWRSFARRDAFDLSNQ